MRRQAVWLLWAIASLLGLAWGAYLLCFPVGMQRTTTFTPTGERVELLQPTYEPVLGLMVSTVLIIFYGLLGLALYARHYPAFRLVAGVYMLLSWLAVSVGVLFRPSAMLLLLAVLLTIRLPQDDPAPGVEQQRHNDV